jgi:hypothetical protein
MSIFLGGNDMNGPIRPFISTSTESTTGNPAPPIPVNSLSSSSLFGSNTAIDTFFSNNLLGFMPAQVPSASLGNSSQTGNLSQILSALLQIFSGFNSLTPPVTTVNPTTEERLTELQSTLKELKAENKDLRKENRILRNRLRDRNNQANMPPIPAPDPVSVPSPISIIPPPNIPPNIPVPQPEPEQLPPPLPTTLSQLPDSGLGPNINIHAIRDWAKDSGETSGSSSEVNKNTILAAIRYVDKMNQKAFDETNGGIEPNNGGVPLYQYNRFNNWFFGDTEIMGVDPGNAKYQRLRSYLDGLSRQLGE